MVPVTCACKWLVFVLSAIIVTPVFASDTGLHIENELLLEVRVDDHTLGLDILGYQRGDTFLLSLEELVAALEFPISIDSAQGTASGWYISPERRFSLDIKRGEVSSGGKKLSLGGDEAVLFEGGVYVETAALERWFPLRLAAVVQQLYLDIEPTELLPIQARWQRRQSRNVRSSAYREPQHPLQETPYQFLGPHITRLRLGYSTIRDTPDSDADYKTNYALLSRGDLAWMTSKVSLAGTSDDSLTGASLNLERTAFDGPLRLNHIEVGDLSSSGFRGVLLRGGDFGSSPSRRLRDQTVFLDGNQLPDWDVELYQNGQLIATQTVGQDGRYLFDNIALLFGENHFELKFYGPFGELESRDEYYFLGADTLAPGQISYDVAAMQQGRTVFSVNDATADEDTGSGRYTANFNLGVSRGLTIGAGIDSQQFDGSRVNSGNIGFGLSTSHFHGNLRYDYKPNAQDAIASSLRTRLGDSSLNLTYTHFIDDSDQTDASNKWDASLAVTSSLFSLPVNLDIDTQEQKEKTAFNAAIGTTVPLKGAGRFSTSLWYSSDEDRSGNTTTRTSQTSGQSNFHNTIRPWTFRVGSNYRLQPDYETIEYSAQGALRLDRDTSLNLEIKQNEDEDITYYQGGVNLQLDSVLISARVSYQSDERWTGLITLSTNLVHRPGKALPILDSRAYTGSGTVEVQVHSEPGGEPHEGVTTRAVQAWQTATTDEHGAAYLSRLPSHQQTDIEIDETTIANGQLRSTSPGVSVIPRPGSYTIVKFPVISTAELEGHIVMTDGEDKQAVSRALVQLKKPDGELVAQRRTAFDGFFLFDGIEPGNYQLTLGDALSKRIQKKPAIVKVSGNSGVIRGLNFTLGPAPERTIIKSAPLVEEPPLQASAKTVSVVPLTAPPTKSEPDKQPQHQITSGTWFVQLAALSSREKAENLWLQIKRKSPMLENKHPKYQKYKNMIRLLIGPGQSKQAANTLCQQLKQLGQSCFVRDIN